MDVSVKPTEMQNYTVQTKYLFLCSNIAPFIPLSGWTGRVLQVVGVLPAAPDVLHHQGRVKDNVCVLEENFSKETLKWVIPMALTLSISCYS